ncbi:hypothetical protein FQA39_LY17253 [Lamprigera yunnana]|nr:hypothetical protein FQA39_LY17253 [Lamprigera yunnana]
MTIIRFRTTDDICVTPACIHAATKMLSQLNTSADPCEDFYEFACGNFVKESVIPSDETSVHIFSAVKETLDDQLRGVLEDSLPFNATKSFRFAKSLYNMCMNKWNIERDGLKAMKNLLKKFGGWPVLEGPNWNESKFDWIRLIGKLRETGFDYDYFIKLGVVPNGRNSSERILSIDQSPPHLNQFFKQRGISDLPKAYYKHMVEVATIFGANNTFAKKDLKEIVSFEYLYSMVCPRKQSKPFSIFFLFQQLCTEPQSLRNHSHLYNYMTINDLQKKIKGIDWLTYIKSIVGVSNITISNEEVIIVRVPSYFQNLIKLLQKTPKRLLANYILLKTVLSSINFLTEDLQNSQNKFYEEIEVGCAAKRLDGKNVSLLLPTGTMSLPIASKYIKKHFKPETKREAEQMILTIKNEFMNLLKKVNWLDKNTKRHALEKAAAIKTHVGYPEEILDDAKIEEYYSKLQVQDTDDNYFLAAVAINLFKINLEFEDFRKPINRSDWVDYDFIVDINAFYSAELNCMVFPAGILQEAFIDSSRPHYVNYAKLGFVIGHEITHGFDDQGRQFDKDGNLNDWWSDKTADTFKEKAQCIIDQYQNYVYPGLDMNLNGINTQGENIADNGGIKVAYLAYQNWAKRNGSELALPVLNYTTNQIFWISAAQVWCSKFREAEIINGIRSDPHAPPPFRVIGSFSNSKHFSEDFNCPVNSTMNPKKKCVVCNIKLKTLLQKRLECINWISFFIIVALFMALLIILRDRKDTTVCLSSECVSSASRVIEYMDSTVNPCENFYKFACGNFLKDTVIPSDKSYENHFSIIQDKVQKQLKTILDEPFSKNTQPYQQLKTLYDLCMDTAAIAESDVDSIKQILRELGGWPLLEGKNWNEKNFVWTDLIYKLRKRGIRSNYLINLQVEPDDRNSTKRVLTLDHAISTSTEYHKEAFNNNNYNELLNYLREVAILLGANDAEVTKELTKVLEFALNLSKIRVPSKARKNSTSFYNVMTIRELQYRYPTINWLEYITNIVNITDTKFTFNDTIIVRVPTYFSKLEELLKNTTQRVQSNYIFTKTVVSVIPYLTEEIRNAQLQFFKITQGVLDQESRWKECVKITAKSIGLPLYEMYIKKHFDNRIKEGVNSLVTDIQKEFTETLKSVEWLDNNTKSIALQKADDLIMQIGYAKEMLTDEYIENYYSKLDVPTDSYLKAMLAVNKFKENVKFRTLQKTAQRGDWSDLTIPYLVEPFYSITENSIKIPAALLQDVFFELNRPQYMNYATLGYVVGHEITHGFDDKGSQFDRHGNVEDWWSEQSKKAFKEKLKCVTDQYRNYTRAKFNISLNEVHDLGEYVADDSGIKQSYYAYDKFLKVNKYEHQLPGLHYSSHQMFWIAAAQLRCFKSRYEDNTFSVENDFDMIPQYRVTGIFSNIANFSNDFNCPVDSPMNLKNKCRIWTAAEVKFKNTSSTRWIVLSIIAFLLSIGLGGGLIMLLTLPKKQNNVCLTPNCISAASTMLDYLDRNMDPCDNFFKFACGNYLKKQKIPDGKRSVSAFSLTAERMENQIQRIYDEPLPHNAPKPLEALKTVYDLCSNRLDRDMQGNATALSIFKELGGWPLLEGAKWNESGFKWTDMIYKLRQRGAPCGFFIRISLGRNDRGQSRRYIHVDEAPIQMMDELLNGFVDPTVQAYYRYLIDVAVEFGANRAAAVKEMREVIEFKMTLAIILDAFDNKGKYTIFTTIRKIQKDYPQLNWLEYIQNVINLPLNITSDEMIVFGVHYYIKEVGKLLRNTPKRVIANYLITENVDAFIPFLTSSLRRKRAAFYKRLDVKPKPISVECQTIAYLSVGLQLDYLYVTKHFNKAVKEDAEELVRDIRRAFVDILRKIEWVDEHTRKHAIEKVLAMKQYVAYPIELLDYKNVEAYYKNLEIDKSNYLKTILMVKKFLQNREYLFLRENISKTEWLFHTTPLTINAYYSLTENSINFPAGILQGMFYNKDRPNYMNYGVIGFIIGHEITHGFDNKGRLFNKNGKLQEWWSQKTKEAFLQKAQCIIDQYDGYYYKQFDLHIDGKNTQGENIADNGGIKEAYFAYDKWVERNGVEPKLPGLNYNQKQLFWISSAQLWCSKYTDDSLRHMLQDDVHAPAEYRVIGAFSNSQNFSQDFNCPANSSMNRKNKCSVW